MNFKLMVLSFHDSSCLLMAVQKYPSMPRRTPSDTATLLSAAALLLACTTRVSPSTHIVDNAVLQGAHLAYMPATLEVHA